MNSIGLTAFGEAMLCSKSGLEQVVIACDIDVAGFSTQSVAVAALGKNLGAAISSRSDVLCISSKDDSGRGSSWVGLV